MKQAEKCYFFRQMPPLGGFGPPVIILILPQKAQKTGTIFPYCFIKRQKEKNVLSLYCACGYSNASILPYNFHRRFPLPWPAKGALESGDLVLVTIRTKP